MPTVFAIRDRSNGKWRRCGKSCYDAKSPEANCKCVCGRANHGARESTATANSVALGGDAKIVYERPPKRERLGQLTLLDPTSEREGERFLPSNLLTSDDNSVA